MSISPLLEVVFPLTSGRGSASGSTSNKSEGGKWGQQLFALEFPTSQVSVCWLCPLTKGHISCQAALHIQFPSPGFREGSPPLVPQLLAVTSFRVHITPVIPLHPAHIHSPFIKLFSGVWDLFSCQERNCYISQSMYNALHSLGPIMWNFNISLRT